MIYGYCRVSTSKQNLKRQEDNIRALYPDATLYEDKFSGKTDNRPQFQRLLKKVEPGDTIVFDEVSRMSRNAEEGYADYKKLYEQGIELVFIKEPQINSSVFREAASRSIEKTGDQIADRLIEAVNDILMYLAENQIRLAFEQAEAERKLLSKRTIEGMNKSNRKAGRVKGKEQHHKKESPAKRIIVRRSKHFNGDLNNAEVMKLAKISAPTFYKYLRELQEDDMQRQLDIADIIADESKPEA
ncbi:MAG: recombinase family protein [Lachnospiraceae bacterium]|nr:recombinase family protein [Lachnospiraceae bacterium]